MAFIISLCTRNCKERTDVFLQKTLQWQKFVIIAMRSAVCRHLAARKSLFCPHAIKFLRRRTDSIDIFGHFCKNPIRLSKNTAPQAQSLRWHTSARGSLCGRTYRLPHNEARWSSAPTGRTIHPPAPRQPPHRKMRRAETALSIRAGGAVPHSRQRETASAAPASQ